MEKNTEYFSPFWKVFALFSIRKGPIFGQKFGVGKSLEDFDLSLKVISMFLFGCVSISLKVAFKNTSVKKFICVKISMLNATKLICLLYNYFKTNFLALQANFLKNVLSACLLNILTGIHR